MKKLIKYFSFALLLIPSIFLFAGCKDEPEPKSYAFSVESEEGVRLTDASGNLLSSLTKLETEGDTTYYVQVRNDKDAEDLKVYLNGSETKTVLTKVLDYNDEIVDSTNYQNVYSFVVPKVSQNTTIKVEDVKEKYITFEFDLSFKSGYDTGGNLIAEKVKFENYDETYNHTVFNESKTITLRDLIDNNKKISIPYNRIVDLTKTNGIYQHIAELNFLKLVVDGGNKIYMTQTHFSPFKIMSFNKVSTISDTSKLGANQGGNYGLSAVTGTSLSNYLTLNLGNLKSENLLKKTNIYTLNFSSTDYSTYKVEYAGDSKISQFVSFSTSNGTKDTNRTHKYGETTTLTVNLDIENINKAFGSSASTILSNIAFSFADADNTTTFDYEDFTSGVYTLTINPSDLPKVAKSFILQYTLNNQVAYNISTEITDGIPSDAITVEATIGGEGNEVPTNLHYAGFETELTITIDKTKIEQAVDFSKLAITVNGSDVTISESESSYTVTLEADETPISGNSIIVKVFIESTDPNGSGETA